MFWVSSLGLRRVTRSLTLVVVCVLLCAVSPLLAMHNEPMYNTDPSLGKPVKLEFINPADEQEQKEKDPGPAPIPEAQTANMAVPHGGGTVPAAMVPGPNMAQVEQKNLQQNCKTTKGLTFCAGRLYDAWVGPQGDPSAIDNALAQKWKLAQGYYFGKGAWCLVAYKKVLCSMNLPYCAGGMNKYVACQGLCIDFCRACGVCGASSVMPGAKQTPGIDPAVMQYCTPLLRETQDPRECTDARSCGWLNVPPRIPPSQCPIINT